MTRRKTGPVVAAAALAASLAQPAAAQAQGETVPGWSAFVETLRTLPDRMLAKLPEEQRTDPQVRQEVARLALEALASQAIDAIGGDADHPEFLPAIGQVLNVGQPNADTIYRSARVDPKGSYRLTGRKGTLNLAVIGQAVPRSAETGSGRAHLDLSKLRYDRQGRFEVMLSAERPAGWKGDWWELRPAANRLMLRMVSSDWTNERAPTIAIERLDRPPTRPRTSADELEGRLKALPRMVDMMATMFVDHVEALRREGYVNKLKVFDIASAGGLEGQFYYEGAFDLGDDEALIVEAVAPKRCGYRSLILTNELYETIDWTNNHSSLNAAQAPVDRDGVLRIVVSARDPGVPNWLDTAGHKRGAIQGRWTDCDSRPVPSVKKVPLAEVRSHLPPETPTITPEAREKIVRARRSAQLQRPFW